MLRKIRLYGKLARFLGLRELEADVASAAEAVRFLLANWPKMEPELAQGHYRVSVGDYDLSEDELHDPAGQQEIRIIPVVTGAGAVGRIIAGVALIALSFVVPFAGTILLSIGAALVLGGVAELLTPVPKIKADRESDPRVSFNFSGIQNTSRQGTPVPVVYGRTLVGSVVVSAGIDTVQVA